MPSASHPGFKIGPDNIKDSRTLGILSLRNSLPLGTHESDRGVVYILKVRAPEATKGRAGLWTLGLDLGACST